MDGKTLLRNLRIALGETSTGSWLDTRFSYDCLYDAALVTADRINAFTTSVQITTGASVESYLIPGDFLKLYLTDDQNRLYIKYYDGENYHFIYWKDYSAIVLGNNTTAVTIPDCFTIKDVENYESYTVTGAATATHALSNGEATLEDTSPVLGTPFADVSPGDLVYNTTQITDGIVIEAVGDQYITTVLFTDAGEASSWLSADNYKINYIGKKRLILNPTPSTSGHIITVYYVNKPKPVYSIYKMYPFSPEYRDALISYAAWKYKYRDREPNFGDMFYKQWDYAVRNLNQSINDAQRRARYRVNLIKRADRSGSRR